MLWDKLRGVKICHGLPKAVLLYIPNLQRDRFVVLLGADGCWQPCDDTREKGYVNHTLQSQERARAAPDCSIFRNALGWDATAEGVEAEGWCEAPTRSKVKSRCRRTAPVPFSLLKCSDDSCDLVPHFLKGRFSTRS